MTSRKSHKVIIVLIVAAEMAVVIAGQEAVSIKPATNLKYFDLPTSDEPVVSWMDVQKGVFPNISVIHDSLKVGEPITILIYLRDKSQLYDIRVSNCWAYDDQHFGRAKNRVQLTDEFFRRGSRLIQKWSKLRFPSGGDMISFLYTDLKAFKFPDSDRIYITCDIQLCFKSCLSEEEAPDLKTP